MLEGYSMRRAIRDANRILADKNRKSKPSLIGEAEKALAEGNLEQLDLLRALVTTGPFNKASDKVIRKVLAICAEGGLQ
jgi:hypothetical protein